MFYVYVQGLEFHGRHGVTPEEQVIGHRFRADLRIAVIGHADDTDLLADTVDYSAVAACVVRTSDERSFATVEALAKAVARRVLELFPTVGEVQVKIAKLLPPMPFAVESAAVELTLTRSPGPG